MLRFTKKMVCSLIELVTPLIIQSSRKSALDIQTKVLIALKFYAGGSYQMDVESNINLAVSDSGYPLQPWLLTPIENAAEDSPEGRYTRSHIRTRNVVEKCNGVLKNRFRCLLKHRALHYNPTKAAKIIYSCCVLHNILIKNNGSR
ncbi:hypothetical protein RN001_003658 [Aquatica leii]|uniref:DDE Tnp4 domain-containing protein n=1 Tax=Aquatica leii TaxID=1421715 RepID=A0AAN7SKX6_9COLE|nr:hypothetical protein RN001_003658 [Aquatica leii]